MARPRTSDAPAAPRREAPHAMPPAGPLRRDQTVCAIHRCALSVTGWCPAAEAYWYPKFACPGCGRALWDNGYCDLCTPERQVFPGDYYAQTWEAGRAYGHYVLVHQGPTPAPTAEQVAGFLAELRALARRIGPAPRQPGDERAEDVEAHEPVPF